MRTHRRDLRLRSCHGHVRAGASSGNETAGDFGIVAGALILLRLLMALLEDKRRTPAPSLLKGGQRCGECSLILL